MDIGPRFYLKMPLDSHDSVCVWTSMAFIKVHLLSWINITMFSELCRLFLNSEIISSLLGTHENISKMNVLLKLLFIAHTCADNSDLMETMIFYGLFISWWMQGKICGVWELGTACQKRDRKEEEIKE